MQVSIREATQEDLFDLLVLGRDFSREAGHMHRFDKQKTAEVMAGLIESDQGCIYVMEDDGFIVGAIVGLVNQMPFGTHPVCERPQCMAASHAARSTPVCPPL